MKPGDTFTAKAYGYHYLWRVTSEAAKVGGDGQWFVWAKPIKRIYTKPGKQGYLRSEHPWHLADIPKPA